MAPTDDRDQVSGEKTSARGALARVYWMLLGNAFLAIGFILVSRAQRLSWRDAVLWGAAMSIILVRYVDVTRLGGTTGEGQPANLAHWRRHAVIVLAVTALCWLAAQVIRKLGGL